MSIGSSIVFCSSLFAAQSPVLTGGTLSVIVNESSPILSRFAVPAPYEQPEGLAAEAPVVAIVEPNRACQFVSSLISCGPAVCSLWTKSDDYREHCPLHTTYVEPFELTGYDEDDQCCHCLFYFCPWAMPQRFTGHAGS